jgi:hypothetical protein
MKFQEIKIDLIHEAVLEKTGLRVFLEFADIGIQPDGFA